MKEDGEGFLYPRVYKKKCINCGKCRAVCPMPTKEQHGGDTERIYLGAQAKDGNIRYGSSSGGVFPILAKHVIQKGGVVFGAVLDEKGIVRRWKNLNRCGKQNMSRAAWKDVLRVRRNALVKAVLSFLPERPASVGL